MVYPKPWLLQRFFTRVGAFFLLALLASCASYRADLLLRPVDAKNKLDSAQVVRQLPLPPKNYLVQPGDFLLFRIFTNNGESILDPNGELRFGNPAGKGTVTQSTSASSGGGTRPATSSTTTSNSGTSVDNASSFEVMPDGQVRLPMVGFVPVAGLRLLQIDSLLERKFSAFYKEVFVECRIGNQRVVVLGAAGGGSQVIPLTYQTTSLLEVIALAGGIAPEARTTNIRLVRGADPRTAQVQMIDLSTLEGMRKANVQVIANDVVYIEPVRHPFAAALRDNIRIVGVLSSIGVIASVILRFF